VAGGGGVIRHLGPLMVAGLIAWVAFVWFIVGVAL
jgi:hypothetical protein